MKARSAGKTAQLWWAAMLGITLFSAPIVAQNNSVYRFYIEAQPLLSALEAFSNLSNYQFIYTDPNIALLRSNPVRGELNASASLKVMLQGTGVELDYINDHTVRLYLAETPVSAGETHDPPEALRPLQEIIITAQKRRQSLQDVPIAVSAVYGVNLRTDGIANMQDLSASMPSLYVTESFIGDSIFIRGIGSGQNNLGFEQAVGQVVDGIFYGRSRFLRMAFLDVESVEILKGPQGALIGKNTAAGAVNINTAKPSDTFSGWGALSYEFAAGQGLDFEGALSGPLSSDVNGRLAVKYVDRDGFIDNIGTAKSDVRVADRITRASISWQPREDIQVLLQQQYGVLQHAGGNNQFSLCIVAQQDDCQANYRRTARALRNGVDVEGKDSRFNHYAVLAEWRVSDLTFTSLTGFASYHYRDFQDGDRTSAEMVLAEFAEDYSQVSQEFRVTSPLEGRYDYIAGLYFLEKDQDTDYIVHFNMPDSQLMATRNTFTHEKSSTQAIFAQLTAKLTDSWSVTVGGRYTHERKSATSRQLPTQLYTRDPQDACESEIIGICYRHDVQDQLLENNLTPTFNLQWRPDSDSLYYASYRRGFKAGGFDHNLVADQGDAAKRFKFAAEKVTSYELGAKLSLLDAAAEINTAIFRSEFKDLQLGGFLDSGSAVNTVTNVASAISQGIETDLRWRVSPQFKLLANVAYLNSRYGKYRDAPCYTNQPEGPDGCINHRQDLSGKKLQFAWNWKGAISAEYTWYPASQMELLGTVKLSYVDAFPLQADLDPNLFQEGYLKVDARLALRDKAKRWEIALIGRNLSDRLTTSYGDDVPTQPTGAFWRSVDAPRSLALRLSVRF